MSITNSQTWASALFVFVQRNTYPRSEQDLNRINKKLLLARKTSMNQTKAKDTVSDQYNEDKMFLYISQESVNS